MKFLSILVFAAVATAQAPQDAPVAPSAGPGLAADNWEHLQDGLLGRPYEFHAKDGTVIAAYVRKPAGPGPFPVVILGHGGRDSKAGLAGPDNTYLTPETPCRLPSSACRRHRRDVMACSWCFPFLLAGAGLRQ